MLHSYVIKYIYIIRDVKGINQASCAGDVCHYSLSIRNPQFWILSTTETKVKSTIPPVLKSEIYFFLPEVLKSSTSSKIQAFTP